MVCRRCGQENPEVARFCMACAAPLVAEAEAAEERKLVSILFVDLVGFTERSDRADPEDVKATLRPYHARVKQVIEHFGGTVEKFVGDGVMAVFGAPTAHGDDAERAVRAALRVTETIQDMNRAHAGLDLAVRAAVNTGEAVVSLGARIHEGESMVAGDVVNTASRLQQVAPVGGVVVGDTTYRATRQAIEYEPLDAATLKGKAEPVTLWLATAARGALLMDAPASEVAPLIGRDGELSHLERLWDQAVEDGRPRLVTIIGPPGIGKSRLLREFARRVDGSDRVLIGRCRPYGETTGYDAFGQQLQQAAGIVDADSVAAADRKLRSRVADLLPSDDVPEVTAHLGVLMGLPGQESPDKQVLFYSARRFVEALAGAGPFVLAFEDLHWAHPSLLELIESLAARTRDVPVLMVSSARPDLLDTRPTWGGGLPRFTAITIEPLSDEESRRLALTHLADQDVEVEAMDRLARTAGGNPLFLEELAASLTEGAATVAMGLPTNVQAIIAARLDSLPAEERRVLQDAAVIGRVFWPGALAAVGPGGDGGRLDDILDSLEARDFIRRQPGSQVSGQREYVIKHALIREVAYSTLPRAVRRDRHGAVAAFLEAAAGDRIGESASMLAHHFREAGQAAKAAEYLLIAADLTSRAWAKGEAAEMYSEAVALLGQVGDEEGRLRALLARGVARVEGGDFAGALVDLDPVIASTTGRDRAQALMARAQVAYWLVDADGVHRFAAETAEAARQLGDLELEARAVEILSEAAGMDGETTRASELLARSLSIWPKEGRDRNYAHAMAQGSVVHYWRGEYERALSMAGEGFDLAMASGSVQAAINAACHRGMSLCGMSRHEEALEWFQRAVLLGRDLEPTPRLTSRGINMWAGTLRELGDVRTARELSEEALELSTRAGFPGAQVSARIDLLFADMDQGELGSAGQAVPDLLDAAEKTKGWHQWLWMGRLEYAQSELALARARWEDAAAAADRALARAEANGRQKYRSLARFARGRALLGMDRPREAVEDLRAAAEGAERLRHAPSLWPALASLALALRATGDEEEAETARARARTVLQSFAAGLSEERRGSLESSPGAADLLASA